MNIVLLCRLSVSDDGVQLTVAESDVDDSAVYSCVARNLAGEMEKNYHVDVIGTYRLLTLGHINRH